MQNVTRIYQLVAQILYGSGLRLVVSGISIQVIRKSIKNLHLSVCPPDGQVRVAVPLHMSDDNVRLAVTSRLSWIKKQQANFQAQPRQSEREMITGESHYVFGKRYRLEVIERRGRHEVVLKSNSILQVICQSWHLTAKSGVGSARVVSQAVEGSDTRLVDPLVNGDWKTGVGLGSQADEDQMGQLQHQPAPDLAESRTREEAG